MKTKIKDIKKAKVARPAVKKAKAAKPAPEKPQALPPVVKKPKAAKPVVEKPQAVLPVAEKPEMAKPVPEKAEVAVLRKYRTIARQTGISPGLLIGLSADQYAARRNELTPVSDGVYRTKAALVFMKGEVISLGEVSPGLAVNLEPVLDE